MLEIYKRIRARREELGISQEELAKRLGYKSRSSINKIEKGENDIPQSKIVAFAQALQTTPERLMGWEQSPTPASDDTPALNAKDKRQSAKDVTFPLNDIHRVPIIGTVRYGPGGLMYEHIDEYMTIDASYNPAEMRGFRAKGDSMIGDGIHDGDLCLIRLQPEVGNGVIAFVVIDDDEGCLKHVTVDKTNGVVVLSSSNPAYPQRVFTGPTANDVHIVGKLIEVRHRF